MTIRREPGGPSFSYICGPRELKLNRDDASKGNLGMVGCGGKKISWYRDIVFKINFSMKI